MENTAPLASFRSRLKSDWNGQDFKSCTLVGGAGDLPTKLKKIDPHHEPGFYTGNPYNVYIMDMVQSGILLLASLLYIFRVQIRRAVDTLSCDKWASQFLCSLWWLILWNPASPFVSRRCCSRHLVRSSTRSCGLPTAQYTLGMLKTIRCVHIYPERLSDVQGLELPTRNQAAPARTEGAFASGSSLL